MEYLIQNLIEKRRQVLQKFLSKWLSKLEPEQEIEKAKTAWEAIDVRLAKTTSKSKSEKK